METLSDRVILQSSPDTRDEPVILRTTMNAYNCAIAIEAALQTNLGYRIENAQIGDPVVNITDPHQQGGVRFFAAFSQLMRNP